MNLGSPLVSPEFLRAVRCRSISPKVPDETRMKQYPFPFENVMKQIAGINVVRGGATHEPRTQ